MTQLGLVFGLLTTIIARKVAKANRMCMSESVIDAVLSAGTSIFTLNYSNTKRYGARAIRYSYDADHTRTVSVVC